MNESQSPKLKITGESIFNSACLTMVPGKNKSSKTIFNNDDNAGMKHPAGNPFVENFFNKR
ncbi:MAG: hypothetical protein PF590_04765 [Candidatus Delongbacteria bacterium]|jgi:hypothetical protein|nr:hypothetical protein [Candidatus Delongbacteria bacterium]